MLYFHVHQSIRININRKPVTKTTLIQGLFVCDWTQWTKGYAGVKSELGS